MMTAKSKQAASPSRDTREQEASQSAAPLAPAAARTAPARPAPPGKRELNKAHKLARIRDAARALFVEKGYEAAALRDVAARSGVGFGTLFDYASNKRDLLFLVFVPDLVVALDQGVDAAVKEAAFIEQLIRVFESYYVLYGREPKLSRDMLRELNFYSDGVQAKLFIAQRSAFLDRLTELTRAAQAEGQLGGAHDAGLVGQLLLSTFAWEVRRWLSADLLDVGVGIARLRQLLALQISGLQPSECALGPFGARSVTPSQQDDEGRHADPDQRPKGKVEA